MDLFPNFSFYRLKVQNEGLNLSQVIRPIPGYLHNETEITELRPFKTKNSDLPMYQLVWTEMFKEYCKTVEFITVDNKTILIFTRLEKKVEFLQAFLKTKFDLKTELQRFSPKDILGLMDKGDVIVGHVAFKKNNSLWAQNHTLIEHIELAHQKPKGIKEVSFIFGDSNRRYVFLIYPDGLVKLAYGENYDENLALQCFEKIAS